MVTMPTEMTEKSMYMRRVSYERSGFGETYIRQTPTDQRVLLGK